jgi:hypothetical protein
MEKWGGDVVVGATVVVVVGCSTMVVSPPTFTPPPPGAFPVQATVVNTTMMSRCRARVTTG